jgi:flagellar protein FliL
MSAAAPSPTSPAPDGKPAGGKKKIIIIAVVAVLALAGGGGAFFMMKSKAAAAAAAEEAESESEGKDGKDTKEAKPKAKSKAKKDPAAKPVFVPFESFTVNLADKESERYAQVIFAIEADDAATGDAIKSHSPAIRGRVLMTLSSKTVADLGGREGKEALAKEILADVRKVLNVTEKEPGPVQVHFSHFVMQ